MDANTAMAEDIINEVFDFIEGHTDSYAINSFFPSLCEPHTEYDLCKANLRWKCYVRLFP